MTLMLCSCILLFGISWRKFPGGILVKLLCLTSSCVLNGILWSLCVGLPGRPGNMTVLMRLLVRPLTISGSGLSIVKWCLVRRLSILCM